MLPSDKGVLVQLYEATAGARWTNRSGWLEASSSACNWHGVACSPTGQVTQLDLHNNSLTGTLPSQLLWLDALTSLELHRNQALSGTVPSLSRGLTYLDLGRVALSGTLPTQLGLLTNMTTLGCYRTNTVNGAHGISGSVPTQLGFLTTLSELYLHLNALSGYIPSQMGLLSEASIMHFDRNSLSGSLPSQIGSLPKTEWLVITDNYLSGTIPDQIGQVTSLSWWSVSTNSVSGTLPTQVGQLTNMEWLELSNNALSGTVPTEVGGMSAMLGVYLYSNAVLSGSLPTELGNLPSLLHLYADNNTLSGTLPSQLGRATSLSELLLDPNPLTGTIPLQYGALTDLYWLTLPVRWFGSKPAFTCAPAALLQSWPALVDTTFNWYFISQETIYKVPLFSCEVLEVTWAALGALAALPVLALVMLQLAACVRSRRRAAVAPSAPAPSAAPSPALLPTTRAEPPVKPAPAAEDERSRHNALEANCEAGYWLRLKVSGLLFCLGWALFLLGLAPLVALLIRGKPEDAGFLVIPLPVGLLAMLLAVPPTATHVISGLCHLMLGVQAALVTLFAVEIADTSAESFVGFHDEYASEANGTTNEVIDGFMPGKETIWGMEVFGWYVPMMLICLLPAVALAPTALVGLPACCRPTKPGRLWRAMPNAMPPRQKLQRLWAAVRFFLMGAGSIFIASPQVFAHLAARGLFIDPLNDMDLSSPTYANMLCSLTSLLPAGIACLLCALAATRGNRGRVLRWLGQLGQPGDEQGQAAAVAALVGGNSPSAVLQLATTRFRTISVDACSETDWLSNKDSTSAAAEPRTVDTGVYGPGRTLDGPRYDALTLPSFP